MTLLDYDREHLWHPYASMTDPAPVRVVTGARGVHLTLDDGGRTREVVDGMSSWWAAVHGYGVPELDAALRSVDFAHVMFGGLTHAPAVRLAERLVALAPAGLERVFLADSGSVSVEVALKMALQAQRGRGRAGRTRVLTVRGGYHGDTFGAMSVCDPDGGMHAMWTGVLAQQVFAPRPPAPGGDVAGWAAAFEALAAAHADEVAAIVVEPVLQGAGGMWVYDPACLRTLRETADRHGFLLVLDEIATGFGRTGELWAADHAGVVPDVMCVGKALGAGYLTLAAVLCTAEVAADVSASESGALMHGPTFMGNALACTVALAGLDLLEARGWRDDVRRIERGLADGLAGLAGLAGVRTLGAVGVVQLDHPVDLVAATDAALAEGVWLRPFRDLVYTMPPYACSDDDVARICAGVRAAVAAG
ncbi:adenosylmethionine--8-amino-7-oxononanoate transaminase [Nocardioides marinquilinus]|uniref:Adenosylmethionine-8-amino-7-oxononanoate aminotransferase n=1 Tax=Nocardioides marinquilinus TaxID=1210400 RepID=A0ABP9PUM9_9ACTN